MDVRPTSQPPDGQRHPTRARRTARQVAVAIGLIIVVVGVVRVATVPLGGPSVATIDSRASVTATERPVIGLEIGMVAPDFADASDDGRPFIVDLDGRRVRLGDFAGRPVWIVFWATWCAPCQQEATDILAVYHAHEGDGLIVLAVDVQEPAAAVREFVREHHLDYHIALDATGAAKNLYAGPALPAHLFLDGARVIRDRYVGQMTRELMERRVQTVIGGPAARTTR